MVEQKTPSTPKMAANETDEMKGTKVKGIDGEM